MGTIIKLLIAAAIVNAVVRAGSVAIDYYQFKDATQQIVLFGGQATIDDLRGEILRKATNFDVPLKPDALTVRRDGSVTVADARYTQPVELFPGYRYPVDFSFSVDARAVDTGVIDLTRPH
jgi:hypothetical protein